MADLRGASATGQPLKLTLWNHAIDDLLSQKRVQEALLLIRPVLTEHPRSLYTYLTLIQALGLLHRWTEAAHWSTRLLRADPTLPMGWAAIARAAEEERDPVRAYRYWFHAFELAPYNRPIRAGVVRTSLGIRAPLSLNQRCLAALRRQDGRWREAAALYAAIAAEDSNRIDLQCCLLECLWRSANRVQALELARNLLDQEPDLLLGWLVSDQIGDENDQAWASVPLAEMDAGSQYIEWRFKVSLRSQPVPRLAPSLKEAKLLKERIEKERRGGQPVST